MTDLLAPTPEGIARAAELLQAGAVVAFPTDTVYGVGVDGARPELLPALFELKRRPLDRRIPMLVAGLAQAQSGGWEIEDRARALARRFWPGALTIVLPGAAGSQAFRAPDHPVALSLIRAAGPIFATSANISDQPDTLGADEVLIAFATDQDRLAAVLDGGPVPGGVASTVVDLTATPARILRDGPITRAQLAEVVELA
ncbi:MAG TPA: L-threonylcarbamoyladenylate synthase [Candidatus Limnocylindria bacterium]